MKYSRIILLTHLIRVFVYVCISEYVFAQSAGAVEYTNHFSAEG